MNSLLRTIIGGSQVWRLHRYKQKLELINRLESSTRSLSDLSLKEMGHTIRNRARNGSHLDELLVEAYAVVREAARRTLGLRHFDVQIIGAMALHDGLVVEMKTGEGKTLVAPLAAYLNALTGEGVHVVTVNDYLAQRDAEWMGPLYRFLGLSVGVILEDMGENGAEENRNRRSAYNCDVTYGTNHEIAFDYLRDNLAMAPEEIVHRGFHYAIIDEADYLLIDEARTPLIISGPAYEDKEVFRRVDRVVRRLVEGIHYEVDNKTHSVSMTDAGFDMAEKGLGVENLSSPEHLHIYHAVHHSLLAHGLYKRDVDYIIDKGKVIIVDEFTGRISEDKRYADGLHQAIEAKERVKMQSEDQTLAKVTYQTFFGRYVKLAGMTGTAWREREEFKRVYGRDVLEVPTNRPMIRVDYQDAVFTTLREKHQAIVQEILEMRAGGRPVLVGTSSVKESELLSMRLRNAGVPHSVLNAKNHRAEAGIIAQSGRKGAVTISTNMAGRGVDIILGGNAEMMSKEKGKHAHNGGELRVKCAQEREDVVSAGGLHVIGTAHHESVRIDDQLRGRAGRQGDPGSSQFIVSLDDDIWKKFGKSEIEKTRAVLREQRHPSGKPIESWNLILTLRKLQKKVDCENQSIRLDVLKYDLVVHAQREAIYGWRRRLVAGEDYDLDDLIRDVINDLAARYPDREGFARSLQMHFHAPFELSVEKTDSSDLAGEALNKALSLLHQRQELAGWEALRNMGRQILLQAIDALWTEHLSNLEIIEEGIGLNAYAEIDPVIAWRREAAKMWKNLMWLIRSRAVNLWFQADVRP